MTRNRRDHGFTLIELLVVIIIIGILSAIAIPMFIAQRDRAKDSAVKGGVHQIEIGLGSYALDRGDIYPAAGATVTEAGLVDSAGIAYVSPWPANPWTAVAMQHVVAPTPGHFSYTPVGTPPHSFTLTGHLSDGRTFLVP